MSEKDWGVDKSRIWRLLKQGLEEGATGARAAVRKVYAEVNRQVVEACWAGTRRRLRLSDPIWKRGEAFKNKISDIIQDSAATGRNAVEAARILLELYPYYFWRGQFRQNFAPALSEYDEVEERADPKRCLLRGSAPGTN